MKAIRIDKETILNDASRHVQILYNYMVREGLTEDQVDEMIDQGRIEFGSVFYNSREKTLEWEGDKTRDSVYKSVGAVYGISGRPQEKED